MSSNQGIMIGEGSYNLPTADALRGFDFPEDLRISQGVWALRNYPDAVVRRQGQYFEAAADHWEFARYGADHLNRLQAHGIAWPAQRHVVVNNQRNHPELFTITARLEGRELTYEGNDAPYAQQIVTGYSEYLVELLNDPIQWPDFLFDVPYPWQHTVNPDGQCKFHDVGLEFAQFQGPYGKDTLWARGAQLVRWANWSSLEIPSALAKLIAYQVGNRAVAHAIRDILNESTQPASRPEGINLWTE